MGIIREPERNLGIKMGALMKMAMKTETIRDHHDFTVKERQKSFRWGLWCLLFWGIQGWMDDVLCVVENLDGSLSD